MLAPPTKLELELELQLQLELQVDHQTFGWDPTSDWLVVGLAGRVSRCAMRSAPLSFDASNGP